MSESVEEINQDLEALKEYATDLGIEFSRNIGYATLKERVDNKEEELANKQKEKKAKKAKAGSDKVTIVVENRDGDSNQIDQFFGFNGQNILIQFGEQVEVSTTMYEFIKSLGGYVQKKKTVLDENGIPHNKFYKKWKSRFVVEKID